MQLLNFPIIVQRIIFRRMKYGELFLFSLISKRSTRMVQNVGWYRFGTIEYFSSTRIIAVAQHKNNVAYNIIDIGERKKEHKPLKQLRVQGLDAFYRFSSMGLRIVYEDSFDDPIIKAVHNQINLLFGKHATYRLAVYGTHFFPTYIPSRESELFLFGKDAEIVDQYFSKMPEQELVSLADSSILQSLNPASKLYSARTLEIGCGSFDATQQLLNFKGQHLFLDDVASLDLARLLKKWQSGESFRKLQSLEGEQKYRPLIRVPLITKQVDLRELPIEKVVVPSKKNGDFETSTYIVRNDGIVGFVVITPATFILSVKDFTEEQMLERIASSSSFAT